ncbi:MAG: hypothetical protein KGI50_07530 [Patescibacteria group bacterium]|nr:hypothetical protein [Patescibacteria group bacterium]MDE2438939.1 hypothetical protein [Patescibacteria group bacterium]
MQELKVNQQVIIKKANRSGSLLFYGNIVSINPELQRAKVQVPTMNMIQDVPLSELTPTSSVHGNVVRVQPSPAQRTLTKLYPNLQ